MSSIKCWSAKLLTVCMVTRVASQRYSAFEQYPPLDYNDPSSPGKFIYYYDIFISYENSNSLKTVEQRIL